MEFIKIDGRYFAINSNNRFRKNWKTVFRKGKAGLGYCKKCKIIKQLTIHHEPELMVSLVGKEVKLCHKCHRELHEERGTSHESGLAFIHRCKCGKKNYVEKVNEEWSQIICKICGRSRWLELKGTEKIKVRGQDKVIPMFELTHRYNTEI